MSPTPQTPPTDRPLTAGDCALLRDGDVLSHPYYGKTTYSRDPFNKLEGWSFVSRPATSAASEPTVEGLCETIILTAGYQLLTESNARKIAERILAALASPPVSERERELEGALREMVSIVRAAGVGNLMNGVQLGQVA